MTTAASPTTATAGEAPPLVLPALAAPAAAEDRTALPSDPVGEMLDVDAGAAVGVRVGTGAGAVVGVSSGIVSAAGAGAGLEMICVTFSPSGVVQERVIT